MKKLSITLMALVLVLVGYSQCTGDCENGYGKMVYEDGHSYQGTWQNSLMNGVGTLMLPSGVKYYGEFQNDAMHGYGIVYDDGGSPMQSGIWDTNQISTQLSESETLAVVKEKDTGSGTGCISGDCTDGFGKYVYEDGNSYEGNWSGGMKNGYGELKLSVGAQYIGEFQNDAMHGQGIVYGNDGGYLQSGIYADNQLSTSKSEQDVKSYLQKYQ